VDVSSLIPTNLHCVSQHEGLWLDLLCVLILIHKTLCPRVETNDYDDDSVHFEILMKTTEMPLIFEYTDVIMSFLYFINDTS
jgi:hypothetical protein